MVKSSTVGMSFLPILLLCKTIEIIHLDIIVDISNQFFTLFTVLSVTLLLVNTKVSRSSIEAETQL